MSIKSGLCIIYGMIMIIFVTNVLHTHLDGTPTPTPTPYTHATHITYTHATPTPYTHATPMTRITSLGTLTE